MRKLLLWDWTCVGWMVKEGTTALIRLGNRMALLTAEHAGLELNLVELR